MTVKEAIEILSKVEDKQKQLVIGNIRNCPFAVVGIKEILDGEEGPVHIRASREYKGGT